jgi:hypothetical protein
LSKGRPGIVNTDQGSQSTFKAYLGRICSNSQAVSISERPRRHSRGPISIGKIMLAIALGVEATRRRFRVLFIGATDLVQRVFRSR